MRRLMYSLLFCTIAAPSYAEDEGPSLMEEGMQMILRGLAQEMEPAIDDLQSMMKEFGPAMEEFAGELGPVLAELLQKVDNLNNYEAPEILPNGDIIIRRKPDAPELEMDDDTGEIEI